MLFACIGFIIFTVILTNNEYSYLETPIEFLKGVGPQRADMLKKELAFLHFMTCFTFILSDILTEVSSIKLSEVHANLPYIQIRGYISNIELHGDRRTTRMTAITQ
jgi:ATP-dependent DNA helicase RecG